MKKLLGIATTVMVLIASVGGYYYWQQSKQTQAPKTAVASRKDLQIAFSIDGEIVADTYAPKLTIAGRIRNVLVKEGDTVKVGQWLLTLDATEAQKNLEKVLRDYSKERNDFDQDTQITYADEEVTDTIKRILEKNQWDLDRAVLDVELKDLAIAESRLKAPVAGVVSKVAVKPGDVVSTQNQSELVIIAKPNNFTFTASAEEAEAIKIDPTHKVQITLDAYPKEKWDAKVTFVSPVAERDSNGIATYPVKAELVNMPSEKILDGMEGKLTFITKEVPNVLTIPNTAVKREGTTAYVETWKEDRITKTQIVTGFTNGREVEVVSGIEAGTTVVIP